MKTILIILLSFLFNQAFSQNTENYSTSFSRTEIEYDSIKYSVYQNKNKQLFMTKIIENQEKENLLSYCVIEVYNLFAEKNENAEPDKL